MPMPQRTGEAGDRLAPDVEPLWKIHQDRDSERATPLKTQLLYRRNDMTTKGKMAMSQIYTDFGPSQRRDFVITDSKQVVRRPRQGCYALINSNGIQRSITIHFRRCHKEVARPLIVNVKKPGSFKTTTHVPPPSPDILQKPIPAQPPPSPKRIPEGAPRPPYQDTEATYDLEFRESDDDAAPARDRSEGMAAQMSQSTQPEPYGAAPQQRLGQDGGSTPDGATTLPANPRGSGIRTTLRESPHEDDLKPLNGRQEPTPTGPTDQGDSHQNRSHDERPPDETYGAQDDHAAYLGLKTPRATPGRPRKPGPTAGGGRKGRADEEEDGAEMPGIQHIHDDRRLSSFMTLTYHDGTCFFPSL